MRASESESVGVRVLKEAGEELGWCRLSFRECSYVEEGEGRVERADADA